MSNEGPALDEAPSYSDPPPNFASTEDLNMDHVMTLADASEIVNANPELYDVDYVQPQQAYPGEFGLEQGYPNQQNFDMGTEAMDPTIPGYIGNEAMNPTIPGYMGNEVMNPTTPGYFGFEQDQEFYSPLQQSGLSYDDQAVYGNSAAQTLFNINTPQTPFTAQTPYMVQTPSIPQSTYISLTPYVPEAEFDEAGPSGGYGAADDIMAEANSFFSSTGDVSFEDPAETASTDNNSKAPARPSPEKKPASDKKPVRKRASRAKGKQTAVNDDRDGNAPDAKPTRKRASRAKAKQAAQKNDIDGDGNGDAADAKPVRKRASRAKAKQTADDAYIDEDADAGADDDADDFDVGADDNADADAKPSTAKSGKNASGTVTPAKRRRATSVKNSRGEDRIRKTPKNGIKSESRAIPDKYEECTEADKALLDMRDAGIPWKQVRETYQSLGGAKYGDSTLPNRYERMKDKFVHMREEDHIRLFDAKKAIEADFESKKWAMIAADIINNGGEEYTTEVLQRRFRLLMHKEGFTVDEGMATKDTDFVIGGAQQDAQRENDIEDVDGDEEFLP